MRGALSIFTALILMFAGVLAIMQAVRGFAYFNDPVLQATVGIVAFGMGIFLFVRGAK